VVLHNIIPFLLYRAFEQVRNDICGHELPVILCGIGAGVTYGPAGMTHYAVEDIGVARALPELAVFSPSDGVEARLAAERALELPGPSYARFAKKRDARLHQIDAFDLDAPPPLFAASEPELVIATHGSIAAEAVAAAQALAGQGVAVRAESFPVLAPLDADRLAARLPEGAIMIENPLSKAPGFQVGNVFVMAGVPMVMQVMLDSLTGRLKGGATMQSRTVTGQIGEGTIAEKLGDLQARHPDVSVGSYPYYKGKIFGTSIVIRAADSRQLDIVESEVAALMREFGVEPTIGEQV
jgi:hypothetical protein